MSFGDGGMGRGHGNNRVGLEIGVEATGKFHDLIDVHGGLKVRLGSLQRDIELLGGNHRRTEFLGVTTASINDHLLIAGGQIPDGFENIPGLLNTVNFGKFGVGVITSLNPPSSGGLGVSIQKNHIVATVG